MRSGVILASLLLVSPLVLPSCNTERASAPSPRLHAFSPTPSVTSGSDIMPLLKTIRYPILALRGAVRSERHDDVKSLSQTASKWLGSGLQLSVAYLWKVPVSRHAICSIAAAGIGVRAIISAMKDSRQAKHLRFRSMPSVVGWYQPEVFLQGGERTLVFDSVLRDGAAVAGIGLNRTEFCLLVSLLERERSVGTVVDYDVDDFEVAERNVDLSLNHIKLELSKLWESGHLVLKNKSLKSVLDVSPSMRKDLAWNMRRRKQIDDDYDMSGPKIIDWLKGAYGKAETERCMYDEERNLKATKTALMPLLEWFRENYPYYHQQCGNCKSDTTTVLGTMRADVDKDGGKATRVEYFHCPKCNQYTKFVRFNCLATIIANGRGRCGEYAALCYATTQAMGYKSRWVVDWLDHLWVEVKVQGTWVHIDPCEAVFGEKQMYVGWGKKHTYVVAFSREEIEDVTAEYCDDIELALERRSLRHEDYEAELELARDLLSKEVSSG